MQENHRMQGHLFGAFSVLVWGTTFVSTKVLLRAFTPLEIMVARFTLGFLALLIVGKGLMRPQKRWHEGLFALAGLSGVTLYFLMENKSYTNRISAYGCKLISVGAIQRVWEQPHFLHFDRSISKI